MKDLQELQRLRWQCRRGMLELDLVLQGFLDKNYDNLSTCEQHLFERLLAYSDHDLYYHLIKQQPIIANGAMQALIERISCDY